MSESGNRTDNTRQCIITRELLPKQQLIRFVLSPDGVITPDLACKLPGRGLWVKCDMASVAQAIAKQAFSRAAKESVRIPEGLAARVEQLLAKRALDALSMARKAGNVIAGYEKVRTALEAGKAVCLLHASDAGADGMKGLNAKARDIPIFTHFTRDQLCQITARENATHLVLTEGGASVFFIDEARRFAGFS